MGLSGLLGVAGLIDPSEVEKDFRPLLMESEKIHAGFKLIRDKFIFTEKRMLIVDVQGVTGRKKEYLSIPYSKISKFSIESAGHLDMDADLKIWVSSYSEPIEKKLNKSIDIYALHRLLADGVM